MNENSPELSPAINAHLRRHLGYLQVIFVFRELRLVETGSSNRPWMVGQKRIFLKFFSERCT